MACTRDKTDKVPAEMPSSLGESTTESSIYHTFYQVNLFWFRFWILIVGFWVDDYEGTTICSEVAAELVAAAMQLYEWVILTFYFDLLLLVVISCGGDVMERWSSYSL